MLLLFYPSLPSSSQICNVKALEVELVAGNARPHATLAKDEQFLALQEIYSVCANVIEQLTFENVNQRGEDMYQVEYAKSLELCQV